MPNRLSHETSPYLQQHADNPVDWYPWSEEAFRDARESDRPILLSIGYSACHWCHVMAHESFEDPRVAAVMNEHFVNVKVDREERPDLDQIYQTAHLLLTRRGGGWPLTLVLTPEGTPFFAGTYFPKTPRYGMSGFKDLLLRVAKVYATQRAEIGQQNEALIGALNQTMPQGAEHEPKRTPADEAVRQLAQIFDDVNGGLGQAPKFPHPYELAYCLRRHALEGGALALTIARLTLTRMAEGGVYDQIGGGFCRYSVDAHWHIPHFEKMLYDNGPLLALYADGWQVTRDPLFERVVHDTAAWILREMQSPEGGYYSSLDADSEHEEGKFYVWTPDEVRALLSLDEYRVAAMHYGLDDPANFEGRHWHLRVAKRLPDIAKQLAMPLPACEQLLLSARAKLHAARERRAKPGRDEKILTSWNALMIRGMARAARVHDNVQWLHSARAALDFIRSTLWREATGTDRARLLATYKDGKAHLNAYLDDHAFLLDALLEMLQTDFDARDLELARALADTLLAQFEDRERGGFYFVSHDHERLIHRAKTGADNATPSGNGIAACALQRLGHLVGEPRYVEAAERTIRLYYPTLEQNPGAHVSLLTALEESLAPPAIVILRAAGHEQEAMKSWQRTLASTYRPDTVVVTIPPGVAGLPDALDKPPPASGVQGWICQGARCLPPLRDISELAATLESERRRH
jgi:uncharacterized protein YyaL (SSP411 family)